jgi:hypothetical protein
MIAKCLHQRRKRRLPRTVTWSHVVNLRRIVKQRRHLIDRLIGCYYQMEAAGNKVDMRVDGLRRSDDPI